MYSHPKPQKHADRAAVENFITAAIISARETYREPRWLFWADNWISGRDRSYESAQLAHRQARRVHLSELSESASDTDSPKKPIETLSDETAAERAAWAAGLALITAPMAPDLTGLCLRFEALVKAKVARMLAGRTMPWHLPAAARWTPSERSV
jgi:hypothetical protein